MGNSERRLHAAGGWLLACAVVPLLYIYVDRPLMLALHAADSSLIDAARALTDLAKSEWSLVPSAVIALYCLWRRQGAARAALRRAYGAVAAAASFVCLSVALSGLVVNLIKPVVGRARPKLFEAGEIYGFFPFSAGADYHGFPSGHANSAMAAACALAFLLPRWRWPILLAGAALALTRVVVGAHYLSDVLAGGLLALATSLALRAFFAGRDWAFTRDRQGRVRPLPWPWRSGAPGDNDGA